MLDNSFKEKCGNHSWVLCFKLPIRILNWESDSIAFRSRFKVENLKEKLATLFNLFRTARDIFIHVFLVCAGIIWDLNCRIFLSVVEEINQDFLVFQDVYECDVNAFLTLVSLRIILDKFKTSFVIQNQAWNLSRILIWFCDRWRV